MAANALVDAGFVVALISRPDANHCLAAENGLGYRRRSACGPPGLR